MLDEELIGTDRELESMSKLWKAFLARMFLDTLDHRKRVSESASEFFADHDHLEVICAFACVQTEILLDCYEYLWTLPDNKKAPYSALVRDALTKGFLLPTPTKVRRAGGVPG